MAKFRPKPRRNGYDVDVKAPDGFTLGGYRRVTKSGYVRFRKQCWYHQALFGHAGEYVFVHVDCPLGSELSFAFEHEHDRKWAMAGFGDPEVWKTRRPMSTSVILDPRGAA